MDQNVVKRGVLFHSKSIVVVYRAKTMKVVSMSKYLCNSRIPSVLCWVYFLWAFYCCVCYLGKSATLPTIFMNCIQIWLLNIPNITEAPHSLQMDMDHDVFTCLSVSASINIPQMYCSFLQSAQQLICSVDTVTACVLHSDTTCLSVRSERCSACGHSQHVHSHTNITLLSVW